MRLYKQFFIGFFLFLSLAIEKSQCQDKIACSSSDRAQICFQWSEQVCGHILGCTGDTSACSKTFDNECIACSDPTIESFTNSACASTPTETTEENIINGNLEVAEEVSILTSPPTEICVSLVHFVEVNGEYVSATDCCGLRGSICTGDFSPVCAYFTSCPSQDGCFETRSNSCDACNDVNINYYVPGPCSGDGNLLNEEQLISEEEDILPSSVSEFDNIGIDIGEVIQPILPL